MAPSTPTSGPSAASKSFFGAITDRVRGRSRSRSPNPSSRGAATSPPPYSASPAQTKPRSKPTSPPRPANGRTASQSTTGTTDSGAADRNSLNGGDRTHWQTMSYGRHSSEWLFKSQRTLKRQSTDSSSSS